MKKLILISSKISNNVILTEEKLINRFTTFNSDIFSYQKIYTKYTNTSKLFKQYPIMYINSYVIDSTNIIPLIYEILFSPSKEDKIHFSFLLSFFNNEFRSIYKETLTGSLNPNIPKLTREINIAQIIKSFIEHYNTKKEKDFIYYIIYCYYTEYKALVTEDKLEIQIDETNNNNIFCIQEYNEDKLNKLCEEYAMKLSNKESNQEINKDIDEIEAYNNWKNNILSLCLFGGVTGLLYLLSLRKSK